VRTLSSGDEEYDDEKGQALTPRITQIMMGRELFTVTCARRVSAGAIDDIDVDGIVMS
jgi:hypothetical protein